MPSDTATKALNQVAHVVSFYSSATYWTILLLSALICLSLGMGYVHRKRKDIGILKTSGISPPRLGAIYSSQVLLIAVAGILLGIGLSMALAGFLEGDARRIIQNLNDDLHHERSDHAPDPRRIQSHGYLRHDRRLRRRRSSLLESDDARSDRRPPNWCLGMMFLRAILLVISALLAPVTAQSGQPRHFAYKLDVLYGGEEKNLGENTLPAEFYGGLMPANPVARQCIWITGTENNREEAVRPDRYLRQYEGHFALGPQDSSTGVILRFFEDDDRGLGRHKIEQALIDYDVKKREFRNIEKGVFYQTRVLNLPKAHDPPLQEAGRMDVKRGRDLPHRFPSGEIAVGLEIRRIPNDLVSQVEQLYGSFPPPGRSVPPEIWENGPTGLPYNTELPLWEATNWLLYLPSEPTTLWLGADSRLYAWTLKELERRKIALSQVILVARKTDTGGVENISTLDRLSDSSAEHVHDALFDYGPLSPMARAAGHRAPSTHRASARRGADSDTGRI